MSERREAPRDSSILPTHDPRAELPTLADAIDSVRASAQALAHAGGALVVWYLNFDHYAKIEEIYGWERLDAVLRTTTTALRQLLADTAVADGVLAVNYVNDDDFVLLVVPSHDKPHDMSHDMSHDVSAETIRTLRDGVAAVLEAEHGIDVASLFDLFVGSTVMRVDPKVRLERQIYRAVRQAAKNAQSIEQQERAQLLQALRDTLRDGAVYIDYHPIVDASTGKTFGYEALARGTKRALRRPEVMFDVAAESGLIWDLSRLCRGRAIEGMPQVLQDGELLFLNIDPHDFADPAFTEDDLDVADPKRVVIEITERTAIKDYAGFRERLRAFRDRGFRFAVDDAGSGYAGLGSIANLEPDFIKLDLSLITGIDGNFIKQDLVRSMVQFANDQGARVIAEGVERQAEYEAVKQLGVHLVQGFLLSRPKQFPVK